MNFKQFSKRTPIPLHRMHSRKDIVSRKVANISRNVSLIGCKHMISKTKLSFRSCRHNVFLRDKNIKELFSSTSLGFHWNCCIINQYLRLIGTPLTKTAHRFRSKYLKNEAEYKRAVTILKLRNIYFLINAI